MRYRQIVVACFLTEFSATAAVAQVDVGDRVRITHSVTNASGRITGQRSTIGSVAEVAGDTVLLAPSPAQFFRNPRRFMLSAADRLEVSSGPIISEGADEVAFWLAWFGVAGGIYWGHSVAQNFDHDCQVSICVGRYALPTVGALVVGTSTVHDAPALSYAGGLGLLIPLTPRAAQVKFLDIGVDLRHETAARRLTAAGIELSPDGTVQLHTTRAASSRVMYHAGVTIALW